MLLPWLGRIGLVLKLDSLLLVTCELGMQTTRLSAVTMYVYIIVMFSTTRLVEHGAHGLVLSLKVWTDFDNYWGVRNDLMEKITDELMEGGYEIPFNQLDIHR